MRLSRKFDRREHLVDDDTGVEFFEKDWETREYYWKQSSEDIRNVLTFVLRTPRKGEGQSFLDIEFVARGLSREKQVVSPLGNVRSKLQWYGFRIDADDFERRSQPLTGGDPTKLAELKDHIVEFIQFYLGGVENPVVQFT